MRTRCRRASLGPTRMPAYSQPRVNAQRGVSSTRGPECQPVGWPCLISAEAATGRPPSRGAATDKPRSQCPPLELPGRWRRRRCQRGAIPAACGREPRLALEGWRFRHHKSRARSPSAKRARAQGSRSGRLDGSVFAPPRGISAESSLGLALRGDSLFAVCRRCVACAC